jgi:hypothetical protein
MRKLVLLLAAVAVCSLGSTAAPVQGADLNATTTKQVRTMQRKTVQDPCVRAGLAAWRLEPTDVTGNLIFIPGNFDRRSGCIDGDLGRTYTLWPW